MSIIASISAWARRIKRDAVMLWLAQRHPDVPFLPKMLSVIAVLYALSPIDLIPDFVPVLGYVDDALILPALIWLVVWMLPEHVVSQCRQRADEWMASQGQKPKSYAGAMVIIAIWILAAYFCWRWLAGTAGF